MAWWNDNEEVENCVEQCKVVAEQATKTTDGLVELKNSIKDDIDADDNLKKTVIVIDDILDLIKNSDCLKNIKTIADEAKIKDGIK